ncbi:hypothetical protein [Natrialba asiatica]|uniref:Uncharacterized protein n=1 Tax=Natrialba asiatica (strain ATCC 700177 / DSM 12278 / JCM 9576 / FERM P-10747 / NBRC 102637 / 172P1) TaxID=29540 RepID=M0B753_NATA1|nr:hypothetical protein [Natrialba asiatica]ELZ06083.1 hypothetical protein C481_01085 [Natrialba asiatica DSM 12278]
MATNQPDVQSHAEEKRPEIPFAALVIQVTLASMTAFMLLGWSHFTLNAILDSNQTVTAYVSWLPIVIATGATAYLISRLYE